MRRRADRSRAAIVAPALALAVVTAGETARADQVPSGAAAPRVPAALAPEGREAAADFDTIRNTLGNPGIVGRGLLRWFGLRVYEASLWAGPGFSPSEPWRQPFLLELRYARAFTADAIAGASVDEMARMGFGTPAQRETWRASMRRLFPDVREGDRLSGLYRPGAGATFFRNDRPIGGIDDAAFAQAFFSIWLDPRSAAPELRNALLAGGRLAASEPSPSNEVRR